MTIVQTAAVLEEADQPLDNLAIYIIVNGWLRHKYMSQLLDALKKNPRASLKYLEVAEPGHPSELSEKAQKLLASFKGPK